MTVLIPADVKEKLKEIAESKGVNMSALVRLILTAETKK